MFKQELKLKYVFVTILSFQVLMRATVFARMAPDQKTQLVKELQKLKWVQTQNDWGQSGITERK